MYKQPHLDRIVEEYNEETLKTLVSVLLLDEYLKDEDTKEIIEEAIEKRKAEIAK